MSGLVGRPILHPSQPPVLRLPSKKRSAATSALVGPLTQSQKPCPVILSQPMWVSGYSLQPDYGFCPFDDRSAWPPKFQTATSMPQAKVFASSFQSLVESYFTVATICHQEQMVHLCCYPRASNRTCIPLPSCADTLKNPTMECHQLESLANQSSPATTVVESSSQLSLTPAPKLPSDSSTVGSDWDVATMSSSPPLSAPSCQPPLVNTTSQPLAVLSSPSDCQSLPSPGSSSSATRSSTKSFEKRRPSALAMDCVVVHSNKEPSPRSKCQVLFCRSATASTANKRDMNVAEPNLTPTTTSNKSTCSSSLSPMLSSTSADRPSLSPASQDVARGHPNAVENASISPPASTPEAPIGLSELVWVRSLGRGSSGHVQLMRSAASKQLFAVKVVPLSQHSEDIQREIAAVRSIEHRNLIRTFAAFVDSGAAHIVQEFMDMGSLHDLRRKYQLQCIPEPVLSVIARQILQGLDYLHTLRPSEPGFPWFAGEPNLGVTVFDRRGSRIHHGLIHRDLKPQNILINSCGEVRIADFGISALMKSNGRSTFVGTTSYMSPERICGERYNQKCDIWAYGSTLVELATGHSPFRNQGDGFLDILMAITSSSPKLSLPENFSWEFRLHVRDCLIRDPKTRPTAQDLLRSPWIVHMAEKHSRADLAKWIQGLKDEKGKGKVSP